MSAQPFMVTGVHDPLDLAPRDGGCVQLRASTPAVGTRGPSRATTWDVGVMLLLALGGCGGRSPLGTAGEDGGPEVVPPGVVAAVWSIWDEAPGFRLTRASVERGFGEELVSLAGGPASNIVTTDAEVLFAGGLGFLEGYDTVWSVPFDGTGARTIEVPDPYRAEEVVVAAEHSTAALVGRQYDPTYDSGAVWIRELLCDE